ncbi:hypothetical protein CI610_02517 [invertebrate metagenome]|uniref:C2H2-type domain-containing protein n=1 Tax=invertebrate metagenome TaxID=1711999 RepID=A0A2H9T5Q5_9ZZZZ
MAYVCQFCSKTYTLKNSLDQHIRRKHFKDLREIPCSSSGKITSREEFDIVNVPEHMLPPVPRGHFLPWKHPFTCMIAGPTGSGKTTFVKRFIDNIQQMMTPIPDKILWCYGEYQTIYGFIDKVEFHEGLPDLMELDTSVNNLIVIDDLMSEVNSDVTSLFTKKSHHFNISVMYIVQNLFCQSKKHRDISLNTHYIVLMKNPRDSSQVRCLSQQMFPGKTLLMEAYKDATLHPHGYLLVDLKQNTPSDLRLRTCVFPGEYQFVYVP